MILELIHKGTNKKYKGKELTYKVYDKYGYVLLDDKLVHTYHPIYDPIELHDLVSKDYKTVYHRSK